MGPGSYIAPVEPDHPSVAWRAKALVLGLVPGLAHYAVFDRPGWAVLFFLPFVFGADAAVMGHYLFAEEWAADLYFVGCAAAGAAWLLAWLDTARLAVFRDYAKRAAQRREWAREGVAHYAAGRLRKAKGAFRRCLDIDQRDPDVLFWYGSVQARLGHGRGARRALRRCRKFDATGHWAFELDVLEARLAAGTAAEARPSPGGGPEGGG